MTTKTRVKRRVIDNDIDSALAHWRTSNGNAYQQVMHKITVDALLELCEYRRSDEPDALRTADDPLRDPIDGPSPGVRFLEPRATLGNAAPGILALARACEPGVRRCTPEETAQIQEAVDAGRIDFSPGGNDPKPCMNCGQDARQHTIQQASSGKLYVKCPNG